MIACAASAGVSAFCSGRISASREDSGPRYVGTPLSCACRGLLMLHTPCVVLVVFSIGERCRRVAHIVATFGAYHVRIVGVRGTGANRGRPPVSHDGRVTAHMGLHPVVRPPLVYDRGHTSSGRMPCS